VREFVPYRAGDAWWGPEIEAVRELVTKGQFVQEIRATIDGSPVI
jgi:hypothetical protein